MFRRSAAEQAHNAARLVSIGVHRRLFRRDSSGEPE
jgi:hypothetical protein